MSIHTPLAGLAARITRQEKVIQRQAENEMGPFTHYEGSTVSELGKRCLDRDMLTYADCTTAQFHMHKTGQMQIIRCMILRFSNNGLTQKIARAMPKLMPTPGSLPDKKQTHIGAQSV